MADEPRLPDDDELLDYLAGRSSAEASRRVRQAAEADPDLAADLALMQGAKAAMQDLGGGEATPGALGWARLDRAIEAERRSGLPAMRRPVWQVAAAAAVVAVVGWQLVAVPILSGPEEGYVTATDGTEGFTLTVAFAPTATEADIRALLTGIGAEVTGGPSALGLWQLGFDSDEARTAATATLEGAAGIVESVQTD